MSALNYKKTSADICGSLFAITDERISQNCELSLKRLGFKVIRLPRKEGLGEAVCSHTDMLIFRHGSTFIVYKDYFYKNKDLFDRLTSDISGISFRLTDETPSEKYPCDALLNALTIGNKIFCKSDTVSKEILAYAEENGLKTINVRQGYPACTTLSVNDNFAITSDRGMQRALENEGIEVLFVEQDEKILLPPYKNGFIGGAAGVFGSEILFLGNLDSLPFSDAVKQGLANIGYSALSLDPSADFLSDLGGIILIKTDSNGKIISPKNPRSE